MPHALKATLQKNHFRLKVDIAGIQSVVRFYQKARKKLYDLSQGLQWHLGQQDESFFAQLQNFYKYDRQPLKLLEFLEHDTKDLRVKYLVFFDQYLEAAGEIAERKFPKEFSAFAQDVLDRIRIEEDYLFPLLNKFKGESSEEN